MSHIWNNVSSSNEQGIEALKMVGDDFLSQKELTQSRLIFGFCKITICPIVTIQFSRVKCHGLSVGVLVHP